MKARVIIIVFVILRINSVIFSQNIKDLIPYKQGPFYGFANNEKEIVIPAKFELAYPFVYCARQLDWDIIEYINTKDGAIVSIDTLKLNEKKTIGLIPTLAPVYNGKKWGYVNSEGELIIPYEFDDPYERQLPGNKMHFFKHPDKSYLKSILNLDSLFCAIYQPDTIDWHREMYNSFSVNEANNYKMLIDSSGIQLTEPIFDFIWHWCPNAFGTIKVKKNDTEGYIDFAGNVIIPTDKYRFVKEWYDLFYEAIDKDGNFIFINNTGVEFIEREITHGNNK
jgi:hypothetical protein